MSSGSSAAGRAARATTTGRHPIPKQAARGRCITAGMWTPEELRAHTNRIRDDGYTVIERAPSPDWSRG